MSGIICGTGTDVTVQQVHVGASQHGHRGQPSGLSVRVQTLNHHQLVGEPEALVALPGGHVCAAGVSDHPWGEKVQLSG